MTPEGIAANLERVHARIAAAATRAGRDPREVTLVCVGKGFPAAAVRAAAAAGAADFGENYVQEARAKLDELAESPIRWHFIGQLQLNKVRFLGNRFHRVHSVDRPALAQAIDRRALQGGFVQPVLVQVNVSGEASKAGVAPDEAPQLCALVRSLPGLRLAGLMTIAPETAEAEDARPVFRALRRLRDRLAPGGELSMGMSGDYEVGVEEGATLVRIGRAIFGSRGVG